MSETIFTDIAAGIVPSLSYFSIVKPPTWTVYRNRVSQGSKTLYVIPSNMASGVTPPALLTASQTTIYNAEFVVMALPSVDLIVKDIIVNGSYCFVVDGKVTRYLGMLAAPLRVTEPPV